MTISDIPQILVMIVLAALALTLSGVLGKFTTFALIHTFQPNIVSTSFAQSLLRETFTSNMEGPTTHTVYDIRNLSLPKRWMIYMAAPILALLQILLITSIMNTQRAPNDIISPVNAAITLTTIGWQTMGKTLLNPSKEATVENKDMPTLLNELGTAAQKIFSVPFTLGAMLNFGFAIFCTGLILRACWGFLPLPMCGMGKSLLALAETALPGYILPFIGYVVMLFAGSYAIALYMPIQ